MHEDVYVLLWVIHWMPSRKSISARKRFNYRFQSSVLRTRKKESKVWKWTTERACSRGTNFVYFEVPIPAASSTAGSSTMNLLRNYLYRLVEMSRNCVQDPRRWASRKPEKWCIRCFVLAVGKFWIQSWCIDFIFCVRKKPKSLINLARPVREWNTRKHNLICVVSRGVGGRTVEESKGGKESYSKQN